ncbi:MAG: ATP-binding cassette domain-containing protein [Phototrophicaceae bacterium]
MKNLSRRDFLKIGGIGGVKATGLSERQLPRLRLQSIGFVFQAYNLLGSLPAQENIEIVGQLASANPSENRQKAEELLTMLGLEDRMNHLPSDLSGGQKQRVTIVRALANDPPLILADEPTGNLDSKTRYEVMELLCCGLGRDKGRSIVIVTHNLQLRDIADRILWLEDGRLTHKEFVEETISN